MALPIQNLKGVRKRSDLHFFGIPLWDIALGPDLERRELHGHARGIFAIGDIATGLVAFGGVAVGGVAFGGVGLGIVALGGLSLALLAMGGMAVGAVAIGGIAIGGMAVGGVAVGWYAAGGHAIGRFVYWVGEQNPEAVEFFRRLMWWRQAE